MDSWRERSIRRKLEQATDPRRPLRRGVLKGERPKGRKARLDELLQARKKFFFYLDYLEDAKGKASTMARRSSRRNLSGEWLIRWHKEWLERARKRYIEALDGCERDGLI